MCAMSAEGFDRLGRPVPVLGDESMFFAFEADFVSSLRCIPMMIRFKLDLCGVKLSLRSWTRFDHVTRSRLVGLPTRSAAEIEEYSRVLCVAIEGTGQPPVLLDIDAQPTWKSPTCPDAIRHKMAGMDLPCAGLDRWAALSSLQKFALVKLTRGGHENENFVPALQEFGLLG